MDTTKPKLSYAKWLDAISKISSSITQELYLDDILRLIVTLTAEVMNSNICSLMLLDEEKEELRVRATQSISDVYNKKPNLKLGEGIAGIVALENRAISVLDVRKDKTYLNQDVAKKEGLCSLLSVPLSVKGKVIGVLNLYTASVHRFTKKEIERLTTVANQASIAILNTELLVKTRVIEEELASRKSVEKAKGILMKEGLVEEEAYRRIQKKSMDLRKSMREIAEAIILAKEIKK